MKIVFGGVGGTGLFGVKIDIGSPNLTVVKDVIGSSDPAASITGGDLANVDAGAVVTFQIVLTNDGRNDAQDVTLEDLIPPGLTNPNQETICTEGGVPDCGYSLTLTGDCGVAFDTSGTSESGIQITAIHIPEETNPGVSGDNVCTISYSLFVPLGAEPGKTVSNQAMVTYTHGGGTFPPVMDGASVTLAIPVVAKSLVAPGTPEAAPGDVVTWDITATFPEGTMNGASVRDIDNGGWLAFSQTALDGLFPPAGTMNVVEVMGGLSQRTIDAQSWWCTGAIDSFTDNICFRNNPEDVGSHSGTSGEQFVVDLDTVVNGFTDNVDRSVTFRVKGIVEAAANGDRINRGRFRSDGSGDVTTSDQLFTVVTPKLVVQKCVADPNPALVSLADVITYNVQVANVGTALSTAFDVAPVTDELPTGMTLHSIENAWYCSTGAGGWTPQTCGSTDWTSNPGGCTDVTAAVIGGTTGMGTGTMTVPVINGAGDPDIAADGYFALQFVVDVSCAIQPDASDDTMVGEHPDMAEVPATTRDGIVNGCSVTPMPLQNTVSNTATVATYSSQDGSPNAEGAYGPAEGTSQALDLDHDGDGIPTAVEGGGDADGDEVPDYLDTDSDDNGETDSEELAVSGGDPFALADTDRDGVRDVYDQDDDEDGIGDSIEIDLGGGPSNDHDADGTPDFMDSDSDNDGIADGSEIGSTAWPDNADDSHGIADGDNNADRDSDNDGIPDMVEFGLGPCDISGNGQLEAGEIAICSVPGVCANSPCDDNSNGAIELGELVSGALADADGDGVANAYDLDSDNDGLPDMWENLLGQINLDTGSEFTVTEVVAIDVNGDGFIDDDEKDNLASKMGDGDGAVEAVVDETIDSDGDGTPNYLDIDSDNDGVPDLLENGRYVQDANSSGQIDYGVGLEYDDVADANLISPMELAVLQTDGDDVFDYLDRDSDGDGIADAIEAYAIDIDIGGCESATASDGAIEPCEYAAAVGTGGVGDANGSLQFSELTNFDALLGNNPDGIADIYDDDSDGDGIGDSLEAGLPDAGPGALDTVVDLYSELFDIDGTELPDFRDLDADGDGLLDASECGTPCSTPEDLDGDGVPNFQDGDSDGDGLCDGPNGTDCIGNETSGGTDPYSSDSDNDGLCDGPPSAAPTGCTGGEDTNEDGAYNSGDETDPNNADTDGDGLCDGNDTINACDGNEGVAQTDPRTADSDGDGLCDGEDTVAACRGAEDDFSTNPNDPDTDRDGVADGFEVAQSGWNDNVDDGFGGQDAANNEDLDSDNDGIPDLIEFGLGDCDDGFGSDTAGDGILGSDEIANCAAPGVCKADPCDTSGNGAIEENEFVGDALPDGDGDGIANAYDIDSDNDGLPDAWENLLGLSTPGGVVISVDYIATNVDTAGGVTDGFINDIERTTLSSLLGNLNGVVNNIPTELFDRDGDGIPNYLDIDCDNDGVPDIVENGRFVFDENVATGGDQDGQIDYGDAQEPLEFDAESSPGLIQPRTEDQGGDTTDVLLLDRDGDGIHDYLDTDSDNDTIADWIEAYEDFSPDDNGDGQIDAGEYQAANGLGNPLLASELADSDSTHPSTAQQDGVADLYDADSDGDQIPDSIEGTEDPTQGTTGDPLLGDIQSELFDTDGDGTPDFRQLDSDGDGIDDFTEAGAQPQTPVDTDDDGIADFQDIDSDNDGLDDADEVILGTNPQDIDSDNDGCVDGCEVFGTNNQGAGPGGPYPCPYDGKPYAASGSVATPVTDPADFDSDDGGIPDCAEALGIFASTDTDPTAGNGADDPTSPDTDRDGIPDAVEDKDNSGTFESNETDFHNPDTDGDGLCDGPNDVVNVCIGGEDLDADCDVDANETDPKNSDTDGDGLCDGTGNSGVCLIGGERDNGTDALNPDSDADNCSDGEEVIHGTDPRNPDTDGDGLNDCDEITIYNTDPNDMDSDQDGLTDREEIDRGLDPNNKEDVRVQGSGTLGSCNTNGEVAGQLGAFLLVLLLFGPLVRRLRWWCLSLSLFFAVGLAQRASAQQLNSQIFDPKVDGVGILTTLGSSPLDRASFRFGVFYNVVVNPLEFGGPNQHRTDGIVNSLSTLELHAAASSNRFLFYFNVPLDLLTGFEEVVGTATDTEIALGEISAGVVITIRDREERKGDKVTQRFGLAIAPFGTAPTGSDAHFLTEESFTGGALLVIDRRFGRSYITANAGYRYRKKDELFNLKIGSDLPWGVGYQLSIFSSLQVFAEAYGYVALRDFLDNEVASPVEGVLGIKKGFEDNRWRFTAGVGRGINNGYGAPDIRFFTGFTYAPQKPKPVPPPVDTDQDGFLDPEDVCPTEPEILNGFKDEDGCPDERPVVDRDSDGIPDDRDECPLEPEDKDGFEDGDGCPDPDNDGDTILDAQDKCPDVPGVSTMQGCPDPDRDKDGVADRLDNCPDEPGSADNHGCQNKQLVIIKETSIELLDKVYFRTNRAVIRSRSYPLLDNVARVINAHTEIRTVQVEGHTDSRGSDSYNLSLSQRRAEAVVRYLVSKGVPGDRLIPKGFGEIHPVDTNDTRAGRAANRRVEFKIVGTKTTEIKDQDSVPTKGTMEPSQN